jgi:superfamily II DNA or RNA helicase
MHDCLVILDEIHHAGDQSSWGSRLLQAFDDNVERRLCLSGTPFKHNRQLIPFLRPGDDGNYVVDFGYDYPRALADDVVREVVFDVYGGSVELSIGGDIVEFDTDDDLDRGETAMRLRALLHSGRYTSDLLGRAHETLMRPARTGRTLAVW